MRGQSVLVTGADGFIGSHLVEKLVGEGAKVRALVLYNSFNSWGWLDDSPCRDEIEVVAGDVRDPHFCRTLLKDVEVVFHLAALIAIPYSFRAPDSYIDTNVKGTVNICQYALDNGVKRVINTSTSEVFGTARYVPIDEAHPLQPQSPYSASKIAADSLALSFYHSFGLPLTVARPFNTYGPRQSARAVIPTMISQIASGMKEIHLGDTSPTRDFNYVEDTCRAMIALAGSERTVGEVVNIGSNTEISIADTFALVRELMGSDAQLVTAPSRVRPSGSEVFRLCCDNRKIQQLTRFKSEVPLREGLQRTIQWFQEQQNLSRYKPHLYNV